MNGRAAARSRQLLRSRQLCATWLISDFRSMRTLAHRPTARVALIHQMKTETSTGNSAYRFVHIPCDAPLGERPDFVGIDCLPVDVGVQVGEAARTSE
jgi:hypothetical protein